MLIITRMDKRKKKRGEGGGETSLQPSHNTLYKKKKKRKEKFTRRALTISIKSITESLDPVLLTKTCKHRRTFEPRIKMVVYIWVKLQKTKKSCCFFSVFFLFLFFTPLLSAVKLSTVASKRTSLCHFSHQVHCCVCTKWCAVGNCGVAAAPYCALYCMLWSDCAL